MPLSLSLIMPTRACTDDVVEHIKFNRRCLPDAEIIVVEPTEPTEPTDPSSRSGPMGSRPEIAEIQLIHARRGRGTQCNAGAGVATGDLLLFLHDDTRLPANAAAVIASAFQDEALKIACFRLAFDYAHPLLWLYAQCSAVDSYLTSFGDQGLLIRRYFFEQLGGFPDWPLFEDVELLRRARRQTDIKKLPARVVTSASRFVEGGLIRQQLLNAELMWRFSRGASPEALRDRYEGKRPARRGA